MIYIATFHCVRFCLVSLNFTKSFNEIDEAFQSYTQKPINFIIIIINMFVLVTGSPSIGKGSQCKLLENSNNEFSFHHISSGDLIRIEKEKQTQIGTYIRDNNLTTYNQLSKFVMILLKQLVQKELEDDNTCPENTIFLLDATPRTLRDAITFDSWFNFDLIVSFEPEGNEKTEFLVDRAKHRLIHVASGRTYGPDHPPKVEGVDDVTGEPLEQRTDDSEENIRKRIEKYVSDTQPLIDNYYGKKNRLTKIIVGENSSIKDVNQQFLSVLKEKYSEVQKQARKPVINITNTVEQHGGKEIFPFDKLYQLSLDKMAAMSQSKFKERFPGMNVIPMNKEHLERMYKSQYRLAAKMDGTRYLMLVLKVEHRVILIDRALTMFDISHLMNAEVLRSISAEGDSLLDGEFITLGDNECIFIIIDALCVNGRQVAHIKSYEKRLDVVLKLPAILFTSQDKKVAFDADQFVNLDPKKRTSKSSIHFCIQKLWHWSEIRKIPDYCRKLKQAGIETDGIIFTNNTDRYLLGLTKTSYKWKPTSKMTMDFVLKHDSENDRYDLVTFNDKTKASEVYDQLADTEENLTSLNDIVVECIYDPEATVSKRVSTNDEAVNTKGGWVYVCARPDKSYPNPLWCVTEFMEQRENYVKTVDELAQILEDKPDDLPEATSPISPSTRGGRWESLSSSSSRTTTTTPSTTTTSSSRGAPPSSDDFVTVTKKINTRGRGRGRRGA
jgi:adenylate kinase